MPLVSDTADTRRDQAALTWWTIVANEIVHARTLVHSAAKRIRVDPYDLNQEDMFLVSEVSGGGQGATWLTCV